MGIGNTIRGDDGIGIYIAEEIKKKLVNKKNNVTVISTETAGLNLLDLIVGYSKLIVVDSIQVSSNNELGHIFELEVNQLNSSNSHFNSHDIDFSKLFKIGKELGIKLPKKIKIYGIGIFLVNGFGQKCNPRLYKMISNMAQYIINKELPLEE